jgi:hypothetical protein
MPKTAPMATFTGCVRDVDSRTSVNAVYFPNLDRLSMANSRGLKVIRES